MNLPQYFVLHMGARMGYAVPTFFARNQMLAKLCTDAHSGDWLGSVAGYVKERFAWARRLSGRNLPAFIDPNKVGAFPLSTALARTLGCHPDHLINWLILRQGFAGANAVYSFSFGDRKVLEMAKRQGLKVVFEQVISPRTAEIVDQERLAFPGIEKRQKSSNDRAYVKAHQVIWNLADRILSPSRFVTQGIEDLDGPIDRVREVQYGVSDHWFKITNRPLKGRIVSVGTPSLRKGTHYLAEAARLLKRHRGDYEFRVLGTCPDNFRSCGLFDGISFTGPLTRPEVMSEFRMADLFVLPTLCEGSSTAHLEALAAGVPVVTTFECGSVIRDGIEGRIVPARSAKVLASTIEQVVQDRTVRAMMAEQARQTAQRYTWSQYEARLLKACGEL